MAKAKVNRPAEVTLFETELGIKFKGPYSDGREWDAVLPAKGEINAMLKMGELAKWLQEKGYSRNSYTINATFGIKINNKLDLAVERVHKGLQLTLCYDD